MFNPMDMVYHIWTYQEGEPQPVVRKESGAPVFPGSLPKVAGAPSFASPKRPVTGMTVAIERVVGIFRDHGVTGDDLAIIRGKVMRALDSETPAYRACLPVRGKWVLAERVFPNFRMNPTVPREGEWTSS